MATPAQTPATTIDIKATQLLCVSLKALSDELDVVKLDYPDEADIGDLQEALQDTGDVLYRLMEEASKTTPAAPSGDCGAEPVPNEGPYWQQTAEQQSRLPAPKA